MRSASASSTAVLGFGANNHAQAGDLINYDYCPFILPVSGPTNVVAVAAGGEGNLVLLANGTVESWGNTNIPMFDEGMQDGTLAYPAPYTIGLPKLATAIATGNQFSLALMSDGTVEGWGLVGPNGSYEPQGDEEGWDAPSAEVLSLDGEGVLSNVTAIAAGYQHSVALLSNGSVVTWGSNLNGELGVGNTNGYGSATVAVVGPGGVGVLSGITAISANGCASSTGAQTYGHTLALKADGTVWAWGANLNGELGDGTTVSRDVPVQVAGLSNVIAIAAGATHSVAVESDGSIWTWGANDRGQLGIGAPDSSTHPTVAKISSAPLAANASAGAEFTLIRQPSGQVYAWGANDIGQLGDGTFVDRPAPEIITDAVSTRSVSAGSTRSLALRADGTVSAWGSGLAGIAVTPLPTPILSYELTNVTKIVAGSETSFAILADGSVAAWGDDGAGLLGDGRSGVTLSGPYIEQPEPTLVPNLSNVVDLSSSQGAAFAAEANGSVWSWGAGFLANGLTSSDTPTQVQGVGGTGFLLDIVAVSTSFGNTLALSNTGLVYSWGNNFDGQVGDGTTTTRTAPVLVSGITNVVAVSANGQGAVSTALTSDGSIWQWGATGSVPSLTPLKLSGISNVIEIASAEATGGARFYALKNDGTVWTFGVPADNTITPTQLPNIPYVVQIAAGGNGGMALDATGNVYVWANIVQTLPNVGPYNEPVQLPGVTEALGIAVGDNTYGLGIGSDPTPTFLVLVPGSTVQGTITLEGIVATAAPRPIRMQIAAPNLGATFAEPLVGPDGLFNVPGLPAARYTFKVKGAQYLQSDVTVDTTSGPAALNTTLFAGDVYSNNLIDLDDFSELAAAFGYGISDREFDPQADLNGDGVVDITDFSLLATNFGLAGDP